MVNRINILLIEDNHDDRLLFRAYLSKTIFHQAVLHEAVRLEEGLEVLAKGPVDIILLDLSLPDSLGLEGLNKIKEHFTFVPVIILSGQGESEIAVEAIQAGAQDYLNKDSLDAVRLGATIKYTLERVKLTQQDREETIEELRLVRDQLQAKKKELEIALEKEKELATLRSGFVSEASHHFRSPLAVIQANMELLLNTIEVKDERQKALFEKINDRVHREVFRVTDIMNGLLKITDHPQASSQNNHELIDIASLLQEDLTMTCSDQRNISVHVKGNTRQVALDAAQFQCAVEKLVDNAYRYSRGEAPPKLILDFQEPSHVTVQVEDFGIGIPENEIESVFQPFFRGSNIDAATGAGLGLAVASKYARECGGSITVESQPGHTIFNMKLPTAFDK